MIHCGLCEETIGSIDDACEAGWIPSFWGKVTPESDEINLDVCCCVECTKKYVSYPEDGDGLLISSLSEIGVPYELLEQKKEANEAGWREYSKCNSL